MIIVLANQKGGVGKSTHCALFAYYLSKKGKEVHVLDMDFQKTLERMRASDLSVVEEREKEERLFDNPLNYTVDYLPDEKILAALKIAEKDTNSVYLFDMPGNLGRENVIKALAKADFIITPFQYDRVTLDSTAVFTQIISKFRLKAKIIFLPTNIDNRVKLSVKKQVDDLLKAYGVIAPIVYQRNEMKKNISTLEPSKFLQDFLQPTYDFMYNIIYGGDDVYENAKC
jgi:chromosome partitioning protein